VATDDSRTVFSIPSLDPNLSLILIRLTPTEEDGSLFMFITQKLRQTLS
jgi:hypothetical protein